MKTMGKPSDYLKEMERRKKESRVYTQYQLVGLQIAEILEDSAHKSLYIRLAKIHGSQNVLSIAKTVSENKKIKNKGAYFMKVLHSGK